MNAILPIEMISRPFGAVVLLVGLALQLYLLGRWHHVRPWGVVAIRTLVVQVLVVLAAGVLLQRWPFPVSPWWEDIPLPLVAVELVVAMWYLIQPRSR